MDQEIFNAISDSAFFRYFYDETVPGEQYCPRAGVRIERHAEREILMTVAGETDFVLDGKYYRAVPGCVFFIDRWVPHKLAYHTEETDFTHIWIHLHKDKLYAAMFTVADGVRVGCRDIFSFPSELYCLLNKRWEMMKSSPDDSLAKRKLQKYMIQLLCGEMELNEGHSVHATRSNNEIIERVQNYIEINYGRNSSIAELEKFSGYNRYYLMRLFKAQTGFTILQYINQIRKRVAEDALKRNISQKEIAYQLGFSSPAAFWLWKKRRM
jgi:AraC-like DNA-binding protein